MLGAVSWKGIWQRGRSDRVETREPDLRQLLRKSGVRLRKNIYGNRKADFMQEFHTALALALFSDKMCTVTFIKKGLLT